MATVPYMDEPELIRLRAMTALWMADLHEDCAYMVKTYDNQVSDPLVEQNNMSQSPQEERTSQKKEHLHEAGLERDKAQEFLSKLEGRAETS